MGLIGIFHEIMADSWPHKKLTMLIIVAGCTGTYSGAATMPAITSGVSSLTTDVTVLKSCMTNPSDSSCTGVYSADTTLNKLTANIGSCMTNPSDSACTSKYSASTTLPQVILFSNNYSFLNVIVTRCWRANVPVAHVPLSTQIWRLSRHVSLTHQLLDVLEHILQLQIFLWLPAMLTNVCRVLMMLAVPRLMEPHLIC